MNARTRIWLTTIVTVILLIVCCFGISAAPAASDASSANTEYAALETVEQIYSGTTEENAKTALDIALKKAEEGYNVNLTLNSNMVFNTSGTINIGTDVVTDGVVTITGGGEYGITVKDINTLNFKGNVVFKDIKINKIASGAGYYGGGYIMVSEGVGVFGDPLDTANYGNVITSSSRNEKVNLGGNVEVYDGSWIMISGNFRNSQLNIDNPTIILGGNAETELLFGRSTYSGDVAASTITGTTTVTVKDNAKVTNYASPGSYKAKMGMSGDSVFNLNGGTVKSLLLLGADSYYPGSEFTFANGDVRSKYTVNLNGGTVTNGICIHDTLHNGKNTTVKNFSIRDFDVVVNYGGTTVSGDIYFGMNVTGALYGISFDNASVTVNFDGATVPNNVYGGSHIISSDPQSAIVDNITRTFNINNTTFSGELFFGSYLGAERSEHRGTTRVNVSNTNTGKVSFDSSVFFGGSDMVGANTKHTGDINVNIEVSTNTLVGLGTTTRYMGCRVNADNAIVSGTVTAVIDTGDNLDWWIPEKTSASVASSYVGAGLTGVVISGASDITLRNVKVSRSAIGGSILNSPVKHSQPIGNSEYATKLTLDNVTAYAVRLNASGDVWDSIETYFCGGDWINHSGVVNTAKSELVIENPRTTTNPNVWYIGGSKLNVENAKSAADSRVHIKGTGTVEKLIYGGSYLVAKNTEHSGNSSVIINNATPSLKSEAIYGGSYLGASGAKQTGSSMVGLYSGVVTAVPVIYGGSNFADYDTVANGDSATETFGHLADSSVIFNGGQYSNAAGVIYGGSNMAYETASIQNGLAVHGIKEETVSSVSIMLGNTFKSVFAGARLDNFKGFMYGNFENHISDTQTCNGLIAAAELGNAEAKLVGNTLLTFAANGRTYAQINNACTAIVAGIYGNGTMDGDSELRIKNQVFIQQFGSYTSAVSGVKVITAGCYGTNDIDSKDVTLTATGKAPIYGGIRQRGNVRFIVENANGGSLRAPVVVAGFRSNVGKLNGEGGNVSVEITGTLTLRHQFQVLGYGSANKDFARYSSCEGDIRVILDGGILGDGNNAHSFICGGMNYGGNMSAGGTHMRAGFNVCKGVTYVEVTDKVAFNTSKHWTLILTGQYPSEKDTCIKFVGNLNIPSGVAVKIRPGGIPYLIEAVGSCYIDNTQLTGTVPAYTYYQGSAPAVYAPMNGQTLTFSDFVPGSSVGIIESLAGNSISWNGCTATYEQLTAFDKYAKNANGLWFFDVDANNTLYNGISANSGNNYKIRCGSVFSAQFAVTNTAKEEALSIVKNNYEIVGTSLRVGNLAMRCRAKIKQSFFDTYKVYNEEKGFKISKIGIIVGISGGNQPYEYNIATDTVTSGMHDVWVWAEGAFNEKTTGMTFAIDDKYSGYYLYAAAVTGYKTNDLINANAEKDIFFRGYIVYEDANGVKNVIYLNNPSNDSQTNYGKTLIQTAQQIKDTETEWYNSTAERKNTVDEILEGAVSQYKVTVVDSIPLGTLNQIYTGKNGTVTGYKLQITPQEGYYVRAMTVNGVGYKVTDNATNVMLSADAELKITYARKTNDELASRRNEVLAKMKLITRTKYKFSETYTNYSISSEKLLTVYDKRIVEGSLLDTTIYYTYWGMPYSSMPTVSYEAFMKDFVTGQDSNGVNIIGKNLDVSHVDASGTEKLYLYGNNCADVVYWSWATVANTMNCAVSYGFNENFGCVKVGPYTIDAKYYDNKGYFLHADQIAQNPTGNICADNGKQTMFESYALLMPGDALVSYSPYAGHVIMAGETTEGNGISVYVKRNSDGSIDGENSYIMYNDQNSGYHEAAEQTTGSFSRYYTYSSCMWNNKKTFDSLFNECYIPMTCKELLDDEIAVEKTVITESLDPKELDSVEDVTTGSVSANYYVSRIEMVITNKDTGVKSTYIRYMDEKNLQGFDYSVFAYDYYLSYKHVSVYEDVFDANSLVSGNYNCKVTLDVANGTTEVVRDFDFTK